MIATDTEDVRAQQGDPRADAEEAALTGGCAFGDRSTSSTFVVLS